MAVTKRKKVQETWTSQVQTRLLDACEGYKPYVEVFLSSKFKLLDIVRITVTRIEPKKGKGAKG